MQFRKHVFAAAVAMVTISAAAQVAQRPPMGWNSWDAYGLAITEQQFRANVQVESDVLKPFGWTYAVIDEGWFLQNPQDRPTPEELRYSIDPYGRYMPVPARFPSVGAGRETSFAALGAWVHTRGLQFGIHIVRGIPRESVQRNLPIKGSNFHAEDAADTSDACPWDPTNWGVRDTDAGQAWYDSLFRQYASWGVDLVKVDCIGDHPYKVSEIRMIRRAIEHSGRPMVLSLSPGPMNLAHANEVGTLAQMWRISDDIWDLWTNPQPWPMSIKSQFTRAASWAKFAKPGNWPDADMLPVGELQPSPGWGEPRASRLTHAEQRTLLALWSMARSPLIVGANLTMLDPWTKQLLTTEALLRIDQTALTSRQVSEENGIIVWTADLPEGDKAIAIFNTNDSTQKIAKPLQSYGFASGDWLASDAWSEKALENMASIHAVIAPHDCLVWLLHQPK